MKIISTAIVTNLSSSTCVESLKYLQEQHAEENTSVHTSLN